MANSFIVNGSISLPWLTWEAGCFANFFALFFKHVRVLTILIGIFLKKDHSVQPPNSFCDRLTKQLFSSTRVYQGWLFESLRLENMDHWLMNITFQKRSAGSAKWHQSLLPPPICAKGPFPLHHKPWERTFNYQSISSDSL